MSRKRIISLILTATMLLLQLCSAIPAYAEGEAYTAFGNYTTTTTFDGLNVGTDIFAANTTATSTVAITEEDGNSFLKITKAAGQYPWFAMYMNGNDAGAGDLTVKFDFYAYSTSSKVRVNAYIGGSSKVLATLDFGAVKAFAASATGLTYSPEKWYNFEVSTEKATDSVSIRIKEAGESEWGEATVTSDGMFSGVENVDLSQLRIDTQYSGAYEIGIDNYSHSIVGATEEPDPGPEPDPDPEPEPDPEPDPDPEPEEPSESDDPNTPAPTTELYSAWANFSETDRFASGNISQHVFVPSDAASNGSTAELAPDPTNPDNRTLNLHYGGAGGGAVYVMPYYVGSSDAQGPVTVKFDFYAEQSSYISVKFLWGSVNRQVLGLWGGLAYRNDSTILKSDGKNMTFDHGRWYNAELGVNWERNYIEFRMKKRSDTEWMTARLDNLSDFETLDTNSGLTQIRIGYNRAYPDARNFYIDNYSHYTNPEVRPPYGTATIESGFKDAANLDETIYIDYTSKLASDADENAVIEISDENGPVETENTVSADGKRLSVKFSDLKPGTKYTVKVSGIVTTDGLNTDATFVSFTTAPVKIEATKPQITENTIVSRIKSYYAAEKPVRLYTALYKNGILVDVKILSQTVSSRDGEDVSFSLAGIQTDYDTIRAYIWDDFNNQNPYAVAGGAFQGTLSEASGIAVVDSAVVDTANKTLTITGTIPHDAENSITIEVLNENAVWATSELTEGKVCVEDYNYASNDSILNYLTYFEQIDGAAGKTYKIVVKNYQRTDEPEIRVRTGKDRMYYHSPSMMKAVNTAATPEELKNAVMGLEFVVSNVDEFYSLLDSDEKTAFWTEFLAFRNAGPEGKFASQSDVLENFDDFVFLTKIKQTENTEELAAAIAACENYGLSESNSYDLYLGKGEFTDGELNENQKTALLEAVFAKRSSYKTLTEFVEDFLDKTVLYACYESGSKYLLNSVLTNSDRIVEDKLGKFANLNTEAKLSVCVDILRQHKLFESIDALSLAVSKASDRSETDGGSGGAGGGGGGSLGGTKNDKEGKPAGSIVTEEQISESVKFTDLQDAQWAEEAIYALRDMGVVSGRNAATFDPLTSVSREEFVKMLVLATNCYDSTATVNFNDVNSSQWFYTYIASAVKQGLVEGIGNDLFGVGNSITRQDMALILARADGADIKENIHCGFADDASAAEYAKGAIKYVKENGIMNGVGNELFNPTGNVTRSQAAKAIYEFIRRR